ncbi:MAG: hypothetical protein A4E53_02626 [Pelotomaculum sp. PtaB.Bin104]|nr:MAG: hypothetical protein A4E53_02626 [Pelotomaculum sp. PtaB.Bin104]
MVKESMEAMKEAMGELDRSAVISRCSCTSPTFVFFIFKDAKCVNVFNGACEDWNPGQCSPDDLDACD